MSTTKHTPGPWTFAKVVPDKYPSGYQGSVYYAIRANGSRIAQTSGEHLAQDAEDNARLIAEAPALLAALKHIAGHWEAAEQEGNEAFALDMASCETCKQLALTAIARAEGRA